MPRSMETIKGVTEEQLNDYNPEAFNRVCLKVRNAIKKVRRDRKEMVETYSKLNAK